MLHWYELNNAYEIDSPALLIYADRIIDNIQMAKEMVSDVTLFRPHVKTHKMIHVTKLMMDAGIDKFKCATVAEAEMLALAGAMDILLAYQPTGVKARRLAALSGAYPQIRFSCLIDNIHSAKALSEAFFEKEIAVYIDLNVGMNRTGLKPEVSLELYDDCKTLKCVQIVGLHAYDGHVNDADPAVRELRANESFERMASAKRLIELTAGRPMKLVAGGTPTFPFHSRRPDVETSPGTFILWDEGYKNMLPDLPFKSAAVILTRVISRVDKHTLCLDLGYKSVASENPLLRRFKFLNILNAEPVLQNEEHLVVRVPDATVHPIGEVWYAIPFHICPTTALYDSVAVIRENELFDTWNITARTRSINF